MAAEAGPHFIERVKDGVRRVADATTGDGAKRELALHETEADALDAAHHLEEDAGEPPSARGAARTVPPPQARESPMHGHGEERECHGGGHPDPQPVVRHPPTVG